jgi:hypothetical protein
LFFIVLFLDTLSGKFFCAVRSAEKGQKQGARKKYRPEAPIFVFENWPDQK